MSDQEEYDFQALCMPHYAAVLSYAKRLLPGQPQEALDLVQEGFARAYKRWPNWRPRTNEDPAAAARGWLHRVVQNVFIDEARARIGHRNALAENHDSVLENTYGVDVDHAVQCLSDGVGDEVRNALAELDPEHREIVVRADFMGEQYLVIAAALGIPLGTVMSRLHRGRQKLAGALKAYAKESYGIKKSVVVVKRPAKFAEGTKTKLKPAPESDSAAETTLADEPAEPPEPKTHCVHGVMAGDDGCDLLQG